MFIISVKCVQAYSFIVLKMMKMQAARLSVLHLHLRRWIGSRVSSIRRVLPQSQVQLNVILHCFFAGERMRLVTGRSFQFSALPFGIPTAPLEFLRVAPHSSVLRPLVIYCLLHHIFVTNLLVGIEANSTLAKVKCPYIKKSGIWMSELIPSQHLLIQPWQR